MTTKQRGLPEEAFHVLSLLLPEFLRVLRKCGLNGVDLFSLLCLRHQGVDFANGRTVFPQEEYGKLLRMEFSYSSGDVDVHLKKMEARGWIQRGRLAPEEKKRLFGTSKGRMAVVILLPLGEAKIDQVKSELNTHYLDVLGFLPKTVQSLLRIAMPSLKKALGPMADVLRGRIARNAGGLSPSASTRADRQTPVFTL